MPHSQPALFHHIPKHNNALVFKIFRGLYSLIVYTIAPVVSW